jgi:hypothetical protein
MKEKRTMIDYPKFTEHCKFAVKNPAKNILLRIIEYHSYKEILRNKLVKYFCYHWADFNYFPQQSPHEQIKTMIQIISNFLPSTG